MKKKILLVIYILLIILALKFVLKTVNNSILIFRYNKTDYSKLQAKVAIHFDFIENYVSRYNYGNILYNEGKYEEAIQEYRKALRHFVPKYKECKIRINYALAICNTVQVDETNKISIENAIKRYEDAIDVLTEKGCANKNDDNGHSQDAETLKQDILREIERLKKLNEDEQQSKENNEKENNEKEKNNTNEKEIEEKIQQVKENATKQQRESESKAQDFQKINKIFERKNSGKIW